MKVQDKVVVVTGAGSGMGRELTLELIRRGAKVAAVDMRPETLDETKNLAKAIGGQIATFPMDITDSKKVAALPAQVNQAIGEADGLINNAGIIQPFVMVKDLTMDQVHHVMNVNFDGPMMLIKAFLPSSGSWILSMIPELTRSPSLLARIFVAIDSLAANSLKLVLPRSNMSRSTNMVQRSPIRSKVAATGQFDRKSRCTSLL